MQAKDFSFDIFNESSDLVVVITENERITFSNHGFQEVLGFAGEKLLDKDLNWLIATDKKGYLQEKLTDARKQSSIAIHFDLLTKFLTQIRVSGKLTYLRNEADEDRFLFILHTQQEKQRFEKVERLFSNIAKLTLETENLNQFYIAIHDELKKLLIADNFYISIIKNNHITFPYYKDQVSQPLERPLVAEGLGGLTEFTILRDEAVLLYEEGILDLIENKKIRMFGPIPKIWMGVPLKIDNQPFGLIAVKSYAKDAEYMIQDIDVLSFVSGQIALAIARKMNIEEINAQAARLRSIFESSKHINWTLNRRNQFTSFNANFKELSATTFRETPELGKKLPTKAIKQWQDYLLRAWDGEHVNFEFSHKSSDGQTEWKDMYLNPIFFEGKIEEISGIGLDISEKKETQLKLQESEEKFRNIYESFQDIYFRCDLQGNISMVSPSAQELTGYRQEFLQGKNITNFYLYTQRTKDLIKQLIRQKSVRNFEASIIKKDGSISTCLCNVRFVLDDNGRPNRIEGVARDINELKRINKELIKAKDLAERSLKVKEQFLANMSHELRTPMNGIIGMLDIFHTENLTSKQQDYLETIRKSSETLMIILNDILDLSKIEAGKMTLNLKQTSVEGMLEKVNALFSHLADRQNIKLSIDVKSAVASMVTLDETRTIQVLSNLLSNAIKFTPPGGSVSVIAGSDKNMLVFQVIDSGIGISKEDQKKLFSNFTQLDNSSTKSFSGTGLGLAISKNLTLLMGGEIGVRSEREKGSEFWFTIPVKESKNSEEQAIERTTTPIAGRLADLNPYVLLVDDNFINQQVAGEVLQKAGARVDTAQSGHEALQHLEEKTYNLIFMDIQMPRIDGVESTRRIRQMLGKETPPVIAMTAYSMSEDRQKFISQGLDDYLAKPLKPHLLVEMVEKWLTEGYTERPSEKTITSGDMHMNHLDLQILDQLQQIGGVEMIRSVYDEFLQESSEIINLAEEHIRKGNYSELATALHTLKGNSGTLGAEKLAEKSRLMELKVKNNNFDKLNNNLQELVDLMADFSEAYRQYLSATTQNEEKSINR